MYTVSIFLLCLTATWSPIRPVTRTIHIADASQARLVLPIDGQNGRALYVLSCYGAKSQPNSSDFIYDGDFECRLIEGGAPKSQYSTLLTEDFNQSRDWESRARFFGSELVPPCGDVPEFGLERNFLLRGMRISLRLSNATFAPQQVLHSFDFTVSVQNDASPRAQGEIAAPPEIDRRWSQLPCKLNNSVTPHFIHNK
jgi:hypothetical protein